MEFLYFLKDLRNPVLDFLFSLITYCGDEIVFLAVAILFFWCIDKRRGYYILTVGLVGTVLNQALKLIFRIERPWVSDPDLPVQSAVAAAGGYSFPSGHTQNVTGTFGSIATSSKRTWVRIFSIAMIVLVAFSRMYLGVHTPLDVGVSLILGTALVFAFYPVFRDEKSFQRFMPFVVVGCAVLSVVFVIFVALIPDKEALDPHNLESGMKNAGTLLGCTAGLVAVYFVDRKYINFRTDAPWYYQAVKLIVGLAIVLGIKSGLSAPLTLLFGNPYVARAVRYFLIVIFSGIVWPLTFGWFSSHRISRLDALTERVRAALAKKK